MFMMVLMPAAASFSQEPASPPYLDPNLAPEKRAADLVSRMTLEEKVLQMQNSAPAFPRLGIPVYNWWNEALHGVVQHRARVFPEPIGLAASCDPELLRKMADAISTEAPAKFHEAQRHPDVTRSSSRRGAGPYRLPRLLVSEREYLPRSTLGTRPGNLRRRPIPHRSAGMEISRLASVRAAAVALESELIGESG